MKFLSLFSGIGCFELGIEQAYETHKNSRSKPEQQPKKQGVRQKSDKPDSTGSVGNGRRKHPTCIGYSEIDKYAKQIYERHFDHKNYGDVTELDAEDLPEFDLLVGGFPCQSFSIAGDRGGFDDTRGTLFFDIARIAQQKSPRLLVLENVKGLLSHDEGRTFRTIITTLDELGYDLQWQVLNSKYHGVPQNRERVFIIGHLRGTPRPKVFPIGGGAGEGKAKLKELTENQSQGMRLYETDGVSTTLASDAGGIGAKTGLYAIRRGRSTDDWQKADVAPTARNGDKADVRAIEEAGIRKLTPLECERLQGFPDGWTECGVDEDGNEVQISDTQRYKALGNAVTVNVVANIFSNLLADER